MGVFKKVSPQPTPCCLIRDLSRPILKELNHQTTDYMYQKKLLLKIFVKNCFSAMIIIRYFEGVVNYFGR